MLTIGHTCFGSRARAAKCWNLGVIFTPKNRSQFSIMQTDFWKRFEILRQFATMIREYFFKLSFQIWYISLQSWSKNAKLYGKIIFCKTCVGSVEKKFWKGRPAFRSIGSASKLFLDQGLLIILTKPTQRVWIL